MCRPPKRTSHIRPVQILAQVHQRQKCTEDSRFQIIRQSLPAGRHARQLFSVLGDEPHDFPLPFVRRVAQGRFPPHLRARRLKRQREVQKAQLLLG